MYICKNLYVEENKYFFVSVLYVNIQKRFHQHASQTYIQISVHFFSPRYFTDIHFNFCLHQHTASHINRKFFTIITFPPTSLQAVYKKSFECKNVKNVILSKKELQVNYLSLIESKSTDFQEFLIFNLFTVDWSNFLKMRLMRNFALRQSLLRMRTTTKSFNVARFSN